MLRKKGILFLAVLVALVIGLGFIFTDKWLETKLEDFGSSLNGALVEIDDLDFSFTDVHIKWRKLQITDSKNTMKNRLENGECTIDLEFWPLLSKKLIVEDVTLSGILTNTDRQTDGKLSKKQKKALQEDSFIRKTASGVSASATEKFKGFGKKVNVDSILKIVDLQAVAKIDSLYQVNDGTFKNWEKRLTESSPLPKVKQIEQQVKAIDVKNIKDIKKLTRALEQASKAKKSVDKLTKEVSTLKSDFNKDMQSGKSGLKQINNWIEADYQRTTELLKIPQISAGNIGKMIFGEQLMNRVDNYLGYVYTARGYTKKYTSANPKEKSPPRLKGQDIYFYNPNARPDFWIKNILLSGETADGVQLQGTVKNIVSNQKMIQQLTEFDIGGQKENASAVKLAGTFNYLQEIPQEKIDLSFNGFSLDDRKLSESPFLPNKVNSGLGNLSASLDMQGEQINGRVNFSAKKLVFESAKPAKTEFQKIVRDIVQQTDKIDFTAKIHGTEGSLKYSLHSNLDDIFVKNLKARFGKELQKARTKIEKYIQQQTKDQREKLDKLVAQNEKKLKAQIARYEKSLNEQKQKIEARKKEIQDKIDKEKKKLGKDAAKMLNDLF